MSNNTYKITRLILRIAIGCWAIAILIFVLLYNESLAYKINRNVLVAICVPEIVIVVFLSFGLLLSQKKELYDHYVDGIQFGEYLSKLELWKKLLGVFTVILFVYSMCNVLRLGNPDAIGSYKEHYFILDDHNNRTPIKFELYLKIKVAKSQLLLALTALCNYLAIVFCSITPMKKVDQTISNP